MLSRARSEVQSQPVVLVRGQEQDGVGIDELVFESAPGTGPAVLLVARGSEPEGHNAPLGVASCNPNGNHCAVIMTQVPYRTTVTRLTRDLADDTFQLRIVMKHPYGRHISPNYCWYALMFGLSDSPVLPETKNAVACV